MMDDTNPQVKANEDAPIPEPETQLNETPEEDTTEETTPAPQPVSAPETQPNETPDEDTTEETTPAPQPVSEPETQPNETPDEDITEEITPAPQPVWKRVLIPKKTGYTFPKKRLAPAENNIDPKRSKTEVEPPKPELPPPVVLVAKRPQEDGKPIVFNLQSAQRHLMQLYSQSPHSMLLSLSLDIAQWNAVLECSDPEIDSMSDPDFKDYMMIIIGAVLRPGMRDTVLRARFRQVVRAFMGSKFLCCPSRVSRLLLLLPKLCFYEQDSKREQDMKELTAKHQARRNDETEKLTKDKKMLQAKYQKKPDKYRQAIKKLEAKREEWNRQGRKWFEKHVKQLEIAATAVFESEAIESLLLLFSLILDFTAPQIDRVSVQVLQSMVGVLVPLQSKLSQQTVDKLMQYERRCFNKFGGKLAGYVGGLVL